MDNYKSDFVEFKTIDEKYKDVQCSICGTVIKKPGYAKHQKSKKCLKFFEPYESDYDPYMRKAKNKNIFIVDFNIN